MVIHTQNPATEALLQCYLLAKEKDLEDHIQAGNSVFSQWKKTSFAHRQSLMKNIAQLLREKKESLAVLIAQEMGKPILAGQAEIEKSASACDYFAEHAESYLQDRFIQTEMKKSFVCYQPLGVIFAIMPWNFPFWQVFRFAAPNLMAGNTILLKHASVTIGCGEAIAALFIEAGFPKQLVQHVVVDSELAAKIIAHDKIAGLSLTGSARAGSSVASKAGEHLKKVVLELGGNDPYLVLEDADLDLASDCIIASRLANCGQVCIAAKRIIVVEGIHDLLVEKLKQRMKAYQMNDPLDKATLLGPMARKDLRETLHQQVQQSVKQGAVLAEGGELPARSGFYYPPTLLLKVQPGMPAFDEELFGPVISIITAKNEKAAIQLANQSVYGLGAAIFTRDLARGERLAHYEIEAGMCFVNAVVASDTRLPFGGIKQSGFGRELSQEGILEFVNIKTVAINDGFTK